MHAIFFIGFHKSMQPNTPDNPYDSRVMANLVSPEAAKQAQPPAPPPPKPKQEEKKKTVNEKSTQAPTPPQSQQQAATPPSQQPSKSDAPTPNAAVAPATNGGASGTPIQTDIGKLVVVYQPDADAYYPSFSKRSGEQGEVVVRLIIDEGGNVEDIALLKYENIEGDFIIFRRSKTKRTTNNNSLPIMVPIDGSLEYIIMKRGNKSKKKDDYIFPILKKGLTPQQEYDHIIFFLTTFSPFSTTNTSLLHPLQQSFFRLS